MTTKDTSLTSVLQAQVLREIAQAGGWIGFERFMELALYAPGLGYYARGDRQFGHLPSTAGGSDFVTAPELSPLFGRALAVQLREALQASGTHEIWEFGAGSGALAAQLLDALQGQITRYTIVDLSGALRERQRETLAAFAPRVRWLGELPASFEGVVLGNEVLDAMPVRLLARRNGVWHERGVASAQGALVWTERPSSLRPPCAVEGEHDYLTEIHPLAQAFMRTLCARLRRGSAFFIDYGFPEREYYHPQRSAGTVMCHRAHRMDTDPLADPGEKDVTAHVDFTALALAAQEAPGARAAEAGAPHAVGAGPASAAAVSAKEVTAAAADSAAVSTAAVSAEAVPAESVSAAAVASAAADAAATEPPSAPPDSDVAEGFELLGYTSQARFLLNCGLPRLMEQATTAERAMAHRLVMEHEMGELFKVIGFCKGPPWDAIGFSAGDRSHTL